MSDGEAGALQSEGVHGRLLASAERRVVERVVMASPLRFEGGAGRAEGYLRTLTGKIRDVMNGADARATRDWLSRSPLSGPLMDALARELVDDVPPESAIPTLELVRAVNALRPAPGESARGTEEHAEDDLRASMRGPDAFSLLVEVAHDFRSPLGSILFLAEALRDGHGGTVNEHQRSQLGLIYSAAFGLSSIAADVMDLAKEEKDLIGDHPEPFSVPELFRNVERMVRVLVEEKGLDLRVVVPDRWQSRGHPHALGRVLLNLTTNALKFTEEGWVELGVRALPHGQVEYYVEDTGRGISPEEQANLFRPFRRRTGNVRDGHHFSGSGIGLSIARRLLHAMGSDLSLDSSTGSGTRFSFVLRAEGVR